MNAPINAIFAILHVYTSARDRNGNCYHSARYVDCATGARVHFRGIGGESNMNALPRLLGLQWDNVYFVREVLPIREYERLTREWPYVCCGAGDEAVNAIREAITQQVHS